MPMESGSNGQEEDNLSTCTQTVDHRVVVGLHSSDSEEERLLTNSGGSAHMVIKRATRSAEPISQQECNPSSTADETCKSLSSPAEPAVPTASVHAGSRVLVISPEDKTRCHSDSNTRKSLCDSNNVSYPEYIPSSEYSVSSGNGMPSVLNSSDIDDAEINDLMTAEDMMDDRPIERNGDFSLTHEKSIPADDPNNLPSANSNGIQIQAHRSELNPDSQHHSQQQQQQQEFHDDYVSSSDYMSSVLSERGTSSTIGNSTTDYFADIDTELESVAVTQNGLQDAHGSHDNNCTEEVDRSDHEPQDDTHAELTELKHALISALPQTYTQQAQRSSVRPRPTLLPVRKEEDKQLYCAVVRPLVNEDFDRHSSDYMYIGSDLPYLRNIQDDEDTLGSDDHIYEEMHQQFESPDSSNGGYVDLSTVCIGGTQQMPQNYQYETTV